MQIYNGRKTVTTAGTAVAVGVAGQIFPKVIITALTTNTGVIAIGGTTALATAGSESGAVIKKDDVHITLYDIDLSKVFIDASVSGEGITWTAEA